MNQLAKIFIFFMALMTAQIAIANDLEWTFVGAKSRGNGPGCDTKSVLMTSAGNDVAVVMTKMNINMPAGQLPRVRSQWGTCYIYMNVKIPQGYTITNSKTSLVGGLIKDSGVSGYVDIVSGINYRNYSLIRWIPGLSPIGPVTHIFRNLKSNEDLNEPLFEMTKDATFNKAQKNRICRLTANRPVELGYYIQISAAATRNSSQRSAIINLDNLDGHLNLAASAEACSR